MCFLLQVDDVLIACTVCHCHCRRPRSWLLLLMSFLRRVGDHVFYVALPLQEAKELGLLLEVHPLSSCCQQRTTWRDASQQQRRLQ